MTRATSGPMSPRPFALFDRESSSVRMCEDTFDSGSPKSSPTLPPWGSMRNGVLYGRPTPEPLTAGRGSGSLLATPHANASTGPGAQGRSGGLNLQTQVSLLPTPTVNDMGAGKTPEQWDALTGKWRAKHGNGNGHGKSLEQEGLRMLPTPRAQNGEARNNRVWARPLNQPQNLENALARDFGPYTAAVERWERVTGVPAPPPTIQVDGKPRLNPAFVEWMQGLSPGWVTGVEGVSRSAALKMLGNGVVPLQALLALSLLDEDAT